MPTNGLPQLRKQAYDRTENGLAGRYFTHLAFSDLSLTQIYEVIKY